MFRYTITRRTFEAKKYPSGSPERSRLNENGETSEYMPSHKYHLRALGFSASYRTKAEAQAMAEKIGCNL